MNQYTQRTVPGAFWELGHAHSNATITVAGQTNAVRHGEYFAKELTLANTNSAVYTSLVTVATLTTTTNGEPVQATSSTTGTGTVSTAAASTGNGNSGNKPQWLYNEQGQLIKKLPNGREQVMPGTAGGNNTGGGTVTTLSETGGVTTISVSLTNTGHAFLPKTPEQFTHDADGNLTSDGRWQYSWDGENRLVAMETLPNLPTNVPHQKLVFQYDAQSRRISKVVSNFNGSTWSEVSNLRFIYDGWNLLAEVDKTNAVVRSYAWGLDLSGTEQGAGGIGGLLWVNLPQASNTQARGSHFVAFDGNGNVAALLNAATGQLSAEYEYSLFGETIRATGPAASQNVFRFSTKYTDAETTCLYYGYRYYQSGTGRWLSRDPIGEHDSHNPYAIVANQQNQRVDYLGLYTSVVATDIGPVTLNTAAPPALPPMGPSEPFPCTDRACGQLWLKDWQAPPQTVTPNFSATRGCARDIGRIETYEPNVIGSGELFPGTIVGGDFSYVSGDYTYQSVEYREKYYRLMKCSPTYGGYAWTAVTTYQINTIESSQYGREWAVLPMMIPSISHPGGTIQFDTAVLKILETLGVCQPANTAPYSSFVHSQVSDAVRGILRNRQYYLQTKLKCPEFDKLINLRRLY